MPKPPTSKTPNGLRAEPTVRVPTAPIAPWIESKDDERPATDPLEYKKTIRIAVTGDVLLTPTEVAVIDTADFQRLRRVRQLGTTNMVYPTALHTRFDHSLGTLAKADEMVLAIARNAKSSDEERRISLAQRKLARMYALLHDVPHVPFGHTIEDEMGLFSRHDKNPARVNRFLGPNSDIGRILRRAVRRTPQEVLPFPEPENRFYARLMSIYLWEEDPEAREERVAGPTQGDWEALSEWLQMKTDDDDAFVHDIVSNTVCADLLDYVARDNYFCNLGISLEYRFINYLYLKATESQAPAPSPPSEPARPKRRVFVRLWKKNEDRPRRDLLTDLTRLLDARYMIAERAYFHHTKLVTGAMIARAIQEYDIQQQDESYLYLHSDETLLKEVSDWEVLNGRADEDAAAPLPLATRLDRRELHRTLAVYGQRAFGAQDTPRREPLKDQVLEELRDARQRWAFENWCAAVVGRRPGSVLVYAPPPKMNMKVAEVNVRWESRDKTLSEIDDSIVEPRLATILDAHRSLWSIRLFVSRELTAEEASLVQETFEVAFLARDGGKGARREAHLSYVLNNKLAEAAAEVEVTPRAYREAIRDATESLLQTARSEDWTGRLAETMRTLERRLRAGSEDPRPER